MVSNAGWNVTVVLYVPDVYITSAILTEFNNGYKIKLIRLFVDSTFENQNLKAVTFS